LLYHVSDALDDILNIESAKFDQLALIALVIVYWTTQYSPQGINHLASGIEIPQFKPSPDDRQNTLLYISNNTSATTAREREREREREKD
jgi:hypothetical protein